MNSDGGSQNNEAAAYDGPASNTADADDRKLCNEMIADDVIPSESVTR